MKILVATTNEGKLREIKSILSGLDIELLSLKDMDKVIDVEEDKETFLENAIKKATTYANFYKIPVIAEDSGLEVDALEGYPGVYSARFYSIDYGGKIEDETLSKDEKNNLKLLKLLEGKQNRKGRYKTVVVYYDPEKAVGIWTEGVCEGEIGKKPEGSGGFGYDPIFIPKGYDKTMAQLPPEEKNKISHRGKALNKLKELLIKIGVVKVGN
ncbi:RdgB/HAM1 family non-canonical purine NTP pyrophosphatase [Sulfurihydrogenibium azorense]|uniref:RdgB/HAM1 family non-canonical purine NTP pyrophosphatase n=1 Tax=Sulfurihydrogenibium azorense TaxID=309806 RepID=UPI00240A1CA4|nr:RdgB/HAM1 family non-canonical purine NTP pyrophosphatase [Sulfurihydrogenibium azorense]MDM7273830.1 RdgB/HAM1 family non-canonical purine NTP pyrophosphatase [Sulfurihydrogenibium azorense]